ncbi:calpain family cysteine protease containing protein [Stylonychia lemnae]|uniref:Calpain family cysteine protease containing protein n=1 Tax=Stylonychia lemnae TaxID=5949 RepID=A0A077ZWW9_STYLE|nr:calpain family cysteine protease containing protein [Stylonychia lemnae]|eukprot:CDW74329.1 calpain family cysteine protease containing protein [Stylonychia lemnae]
MNLISLTVLALLFSSTIGVKSHFKIKNPFKVNKQQSKFSCTSAIERWKSGPGDYKSIFKTQPANWIDQQFQPNEDAIAWPQPLTANELTGYKSASWERLGQLNPKSTLFGTSGYINDIVQGNIGDCYMLSGSAAVAEDNERFKQNFVSLEKNNAGIYGFNVWVRGIPFVQIIDDSVPYDKKQKEYIMAGVGEDGALWGPLLEKSWAKTVGNYEIAGLGGSQSEVVNYLTNAPSEIFDTKDLNAASMFEILNSADDKNFIMTIGTPGGSDKDICLYNLPCGHAYTLIDSTIVKSADGKQQYKLVQVRNPWRADQDFNGKWNDNAKIWSTPGQTFAKQVNLEKKDDGLMWMEDFEVLKAFDQFEIGYYRPGWKHSWYEKLNDDGETSQYFITLDAPTLLDIKVEFYNPKMYGYDCRGEEISGGQLQLIQVGSNKVLQSKEITDSDRNGYINQSSSPVAAGKYRIEIQVQWTDKDVKDYTLSIYSAKKITITDSKGQSNEIGAHDYSLRQ